MSLPLVIELQRLASDSNSSVDQLLRQSLVVASKLEIEDFRQWVSWELHGYPDSSEVPDYRKVAVEVRAINPEQGRLIPFILPSEAEEMLQRLPMRQATTSLVELAATPSTSFQMQLPPRIRNVLLAVQGDFPMEPVVQVSRVYITRAIDAVRNTVLEWSLRLEKQGILGEEMKFTTEEKAAAKAGGDIHIQNFSGVFGDLVNSTVVQNIQPIQASEIASLEEALEKAGLQRIDIDQLKEALNSDPMPSQGGRLGPRVSTWVGAMIAKAANGAWQVSLDTAAKLLPAAIAAYYGLKV